MSRKSMIKIREAVQILGTYPVSRACSLSHALIDLIRKDQYAYTLQDHNYQELMDGIMSCIKEREQELKILKELMA